MAEFEEIGTRLRDLRGQDTQSAFAAELGVHKNTWALYEAGKRFPAGDVLQALAARGYNIHWIITGQGSEFVDEDAFAVGEDSAGYVDSRFGDFTLLPRYDVQVAGGDGRAVSSEQVVDWLAFRRQFLSFLGLSPDKSALVKVVGDSMSPTLCAGDTVLIDLVSKAIPPAASDRQAPIFVFRVPGEDVLSVKRLEFGHDVERGSWVRAVSDSPSVPPRYWPADQLDDLLVLGRVRWAGHTFF